MFKSLVERYLMPEPKGFVFVAARLKQGRKPLEIREEIMRETGSSKLVAGKLVEETRRAIKVAKGNLLVGSGLVLWLGSLAVYLLVAAAAVDLRVLLGLVLGIAQFMAGWEVWTSYRVAGKLAIG